MKKIISLFVFKLCLNISQLLRIEYWIMGSPVGKHTYKFFLGLGPKMLLVRDGKVNSLGNALSIICAFDEKGKILYSLLTCLDTEKNDSVYYGKSNVYDTYQKLTFE